MLTQKEAAAEIAASPCRDFMAFAILMEGISRHGIPATENVEANVAKCYAIADAMIAARKGEK